MPVLMAGTIVTEVLSSGGASVSTTTSSMARKGYGFVSIWAEVDVWVVIGPSPVAQVPASGAAAPGVRVSAGQVSDFAVSNGDKVAAVNI